MRLIPIFTAMILTLTPTLTRAAEEAALHTLLDELNFMLTLIESEQAKPRASETHRFNYEKLKADLRIIQDGLHDHINQAFTAPDHRPLQGQYR